MPNNHDAHRTYASQLHEHDPLFTRYEHLSHLPRESTALVLLRNVGSRVKPIMRKHGWRVPTLAEFLPAQQNLLGLNVNKGQKICLRLRFHHHPDLFLEIEQLVDTMLHELAHIIFGPHDDKFHRLWDELRDEYAVLKAKGYTGEGFLSAGRRLGSGGAGGRTQQQRLPAPPSPQEMRRLARVNAEQRRAQGMLAVGSGQRLGGAPIHDRRGDVDIRQIIADQVERRNTINDGCASMRKDAGALAEEAAKTTFSTKAEEDDANDRAIAQALFELMQQEEFEKLEKEGKNGRDGSQRNPGPSPLSGGHSSRDNVPSEEEQMRWAMQSSLASTSTTEELYNSPPPIPLASKPRSSSSGRSPVNSTVKPDAPLPPIKDLLSDPPPSIPPLPKPLPQFHHHSLPRSSTIVDLTSDVQSSSHKSEPSEIPTSSTIKNDISDQWTCQICTCINPSQFLACDACGVERPSLNSGSIRSNSNAANSAATTTRRRRAPSSPPLASKALRRRAENGSQTATSDSVSIHKHNPGVKQETKTLGWNCNRCGAFMEHQWWTCSACGLMKASS